MPDWKKLKAGMLEAILEKGSLRYISYGRTELIRMVYSAIRTEGWLTSEPKIIHEKVEASEDGFFVTTHCKYDSKGADFEAFYTIRGRPDNSIEFTMDGIALSAFKKNRIGYCILHPLDGCTGKPCRIQHSNDTWEESEFPAHVSPTAPFRDLKAMEWNMQPAGSIRLTFEGEIFETEDHRNWTDASYKTYCTPLSIPYPVLLEKGSKIFQRIILKFTPSSGQPVSMPEKGVHIRFDPEKTYPLLPLGICSTTRGKSITLPETQIIREAGFCSYRIEVYTFQPEWEIKLEQNIREAGDLDLKLEIALFCDDESIGESLKTFIGRLKDEVDKIERIILFHQTVYSTPPALWNTASLQLRKELPGVKLAAGTNANFTQLNRGRPVFSDYDELVFSVHPQEHAFDNATLTENLAAQQHVVNSARQFSNGKSVIVTPVTLQRRFNANREYFEQHVDGNSMPWQTDLRIISLFGAAWTGGSLLNLTKAGACSATYFETAGERGIIQGEYPSRWPGQFPSHEGMIFPVYHILRKYNHWRRNGFRMISAVSSSPLLAEAMFVVNNDTIEGMVFNYTPFSQEISLGLKNRFLISRFNEVTYLHASNSEDFFDTTNPDCQFNETITLSPHEIIFFRQHAYPESIV